MNDLYPRVIDILVSPTFNSHKVAIDLAKQYPDVFLAITRPAWMEQVDVLLREGLKVDAIKLWRGETGSGLREAKDAVDLRAQELGV